MLDKKYRLPKEARMKNSAIFSSRFFLLKTEKNKEQYSRFGFVVSKKISKSAVVRNRIKRQIRRCIEESLDNIITGVDMLFIARKESIDADTEEICFLLSKLLKQKKFIK